MAKDFPKTGEGGTGAPVASQAEPETSPEPVAPAAPAVPTATPEQHAKALGGVKTVQRAARVNGEPEKFELFHQFHAGAEALHGWKEHAHHEGKPIHLSREDYESALKAAAAPVTRALDKDGKPTGEPIDSTEAANKGIPTITDYEPHQPALSPHKGKGL
jgi:hypothetical protein